LLLTVGTLFAAISARIAAFAVYGLPLPILG
jgi:hypothetical protein